MVPLLLSTGYHLTADIRGAARAAGAPVADPLGPDPRLAEALADRLAEAGRPAGTPTVLAAAGSADPMRRRTWRARQRCWPTGSARRSPRHSPPRGSRP